jgi:hypothetical protein
MRNRGSKSGRETRVAISGNFLIYMDILYKGKIN